MEKGRQKLKERLHGIRKTDKTILNAAKERFDSLAKPPGSLGKLEEIGIKLWGIHGTVSEDNFKNSEYQLKKRCVIILSADNGVVEEKVSSTPQSVTALQTINMLRGVTGSAVIAKQFHTDLMVADVGINGDLFHPNLIQKKIRKSTNNITNQPAMTLEEALQAIQIGIELVKEAKEQGYQVIGVGEMGIGNTTTSSAVLSALLGLKEDEIAYTVGKGAGLTEEWYRNKLRVIKTALELHKPIKEDPIDILSKVGGFDLAAMTGVYVGAAYYGLPVVIDGFISVVAALCAVRLNDTVKDYIFPSHHSFERGYDLAIKELGLDPALALNMRLGEGSGCPIMFEIMDTALSILKNMATFEEAEIDNEYLNAIKDIEAF